MKEDALELMDEELEDKQTRQTIRRGFIRKVYGIIFFQLLMTTIIIYIAMTNELIMKYIYANVWPLYISCISAVLLIIILICGHMTEIVPLNFILLFAITFCEAVMASYTTIYFEPVSVLACAGLTMIIVFGLTMYACFTKRDITMMGGFLFCCSLLLCFLGIIGIFYTSHFYQMFLDSIGVLLMSLYLIYDTQLVVGEKQHLIDIDDYIYAALLIYLDIIVLFIRILRLLGTKKK